MERLEMADQANGGSRLPRGGSWARVCRDVGDASSEINLELTYSTVQVTCDKGGVGNDHGGMHSATSSHQSRLLIMLYRSTSMRLLEVAGFFGAAGAG